MHIIFFGDKPIILTTKIEKETNFKVFLLKHVDIEKVIESLQKPDISAVHLVHDNSEKLLKLFLKLLPNVIAGGGKVSNSNNEVLFIYRNNKWDLPKGKTEIGESIEETALREVEEETGVKELKIESPLPTTYHIFKRNGKYKIKITHWFNMTTDYKGKPIPEQEEDITEVAWLDKTKIESALDNSYANIKLLF